MSNQPNKDQSNRGKKRRAAREASRIPSRGAGQPIPTRTPGGQPATNSLAALAKEGGGQVPLNIPQLMAKVGALTVERDFWMSAAVQLESQVATLTGGGTVPSVEDVAAAEEEIQDIPVTFDECPGCAVSLAPGAAHAEGCEFEGAAFADDEEEPSVPVGANVPPKTLPSELTEEEQAVVEEAKTALQQAEWVETAEQALQKEAPE